MIFRPCIDLHDGKVKQIVGGSLKESSVKENFISPYDSEYYASMYKADNLKGGHMIMLGKGNENEVFKALKAYPGGLQVGGGITSENALEYLEKGASHVIVTSYIFPEGKFDLKRLEALTNAIGKERLVIDLSCRKMGNDYFVVTDRWQKFTDYKITEENLNYLSNYCSEFLIHGVDVEGLSNGIEIPLVESIGNWAQIPCTYAGGITSIQDIEIIKNAGKGRLDYTVGSALDIFGGHLQYKDLVHMT